MVLGSVLSNARRDHRIKRRAAGHRP